MAKGEVDDMKINPLDIQEIVIEEIRKHYSNGIMLPFTIRWWVPIGMDLESFLNWVILDSLQIVPKSLIWG